MSLTAPRLGAASLVAGRSRAGLLRSARPRPRVRAARRRRSSSFAPAALGPESPGGASEPSRDAPGLGLSDAELVILLGSEDENVLTTALSRSIAVEDYGLAAKLSERLRALQGASGEPAGEILDWRALGMAEWLCARAEQLGFRYPTAVQRRAALAFFKKRDVVLQAQTGSGKTLAYLMPSLDNMDFVARRMLQVLIVVPSRELVIQTVMLTFRLFGGNVNVGVPGDPGNMFNYFGPQGLKCVGVFEEDHETREGFADVAEVVVGTPDALARMKRSGFLDVDLAQTIIADEADQLFELHAEAMDELLKPSPYAPVMEDRQIVLCGVRVPEEATARCRARGFLRPEGSAGGVHGEPGEGAPRGVAQAPGRAAAQETRRPRAADPRGRPRRGAGRAAAADGGVLPERGGGGGGGDAAEEIAVGAHKVAVLLPDGKEAVRIMQDFKNQRTTLLLCTPEVERGLDMPGIDHVYSLDAPGSSASYLHRAGRCGRVGASSSGCVTAVVSPEEEAALDQCMLDLELRDWEALEEETNAPPPMTMVGEATIAAEGEEDVPSTFEASSADEAAREEERQLTAASLNDLFYLVDAQADVVNQLEEIFAGDDADKEEEEEELDADDEEKARQLEDIRKIFEIFDERGEGNEDEAPKDEEESFDPNEKKKRVRFVSIEPPRPPSAIPARASRLPRASARMDVITDAPGDIHTIFSAHANSGSATDVTPSASTSFSHAEKVGDLSDVLGSRVVSFSDVYAELAPEESTLEVRSEGNWEGFAPAADHGTLVRRSSVTVTLQEDDVSATLEIAPVVPA